MLPHFSKFVKTCKLVRAMGCDCDPRNNTSALFCYFSKEKINISRSVLMIHHKQDYIKFFKKKTRESRCNT